jgi:hypothetical protein
MALVSTAFRTEGIDCMLRCCACCNTPVGDTLAHLTRLTHLSLAGPYGEVEFDHDDDDDDGEAEFGRGLAFLPLQHVQHLTDLQELVLDVEPFKIVTAAALSSLQRLTLLELGSGGGGYLVFEPAALGCVPQLARLVLTKFTLPGGGDSMTEFMSHLGALQQLEHLALRVIPRNASAAPAAAFAALTASSKLEHLEMRSIHMEHDAWAHMFPPQQQHPALRYVAVSGCFHPRRVAADDVGMLVSFCSNLQRLELEHGNGSKLEIPGGKLLAPLQTLQQLTHLAVNYVDDVDVTASLVHLTRLRALEVSRPNTLSAGLLQLTQLQQLTELKVSTGSAAHTEVKFKQKVGEYDDYTSNGYSAQQGSGFMVCTAVSGLGLQCKAVGLWQKEEAIGPYEMPQSSKVLTAHCMCAQLTVCCNCTLLSAAPTGYSR